MTTPNPHQAQAPVPPQPQGYPPAAPPQQAQPYAQAPQQAQPYAQAPQHPQQTQPQTHWQRGGGPALDGAGTYTSPIPVHRTHLGHALASEWTKIRTVRSTMWTLGTMLVLVVGISFLTALGLSGSDWVGMPLLAGGMFGLMLGQICILTLGVLVITSEYGTGMIRATFTASPQRARVFTAKAIVFVLLAFVMTTVACALSALIQSTMLSDQTVPRYLLEGNLGDTPFKDSIQDGQLIATGSEWLGATVGAGLYVALLGLLSLAVGALLRHSAGAITTMLALVLLPLLLALFMQTESLRKVQEKLIEYSPLNGLASLYRIPMNGGDGNGWDMLGILAVVTAAAMAGAYALLSQRDV